MSTHPTVSRQDWIEARKRLLAKEKELTRLRDDLARQRRELPWVKLTKSYVFEGADGNKPLDALFGAHSQLVVYHTYSTYERGLDMMNAAYHYMDLLPKGRDEAGLPWPMAWVRRHDQYGD